MTSLSSLASDGLLMQDLEELVPGDDPVVVEVNPPKGQKIHTNPIRMNMVLRPGDLYLIGTFFSG